MQDVVSSCMVTPARRTTKLQVRRILNKGVLWVVIQQLCLILEFPIIMNPHRMRDLYTRSRDKMTCTIKPTSGSSVQFLNSLSLLFEVQGKRRKERKEQTCTVYHANYIVSKMVRMQLHGFA